MVYRAPDGETYSLNLIDTPGHVDFSYEVSRSLAACEGALLVVDASQGVQAQTIANVSLALRQNLTVIPVINKIDLPAADVALCRQQIEEILAIPADDALLVSAKDNRGIAEVLHAVVTRIPAPRPSEDSVLRALIFDSVYDAYRGVVTYVRVVSGEVRAGMPVRMINSRRDSEVKEVGFFSPEMRPDRVLREGDVGYVISAIKNPNEIQIGDTMTGLKQPATKPLPGFRQVQPMVFSGIYPVDTNDFEALRLSISRLQLNDAAFQAQAEMSTALGAGFRCGFLGLLHMEIVQERLHREHGMDIILTYPSVVFHVYLNDGTMIALDNPVHLPDPTRIDHIEEPMIRAQIICPGTCLGPVMNLIMNKRGVCEKTLTADPRHVILTALMPLHEVIVDFHDKLKTVTRGYGSMDYEPAGYQAAPLVRLEMLVNGETVDAFASIVHQDNAASRGRQLAGRLRDVIPPQMFQIAVQAAVGGKIVARETVRALRKNVTAKCYGGDITRKRKLLEKQKEGKKRMKQFGKVSIPQEAFVAVLKATED
jgi:GTP-binding protein LepA